MSLINEALRKARQEAVGRGMPAPPALQQPRSRLGAGLVLGAAIALAAALAGAAAVWWLVGGGGQSDADAVASPTRGAVAETAPRQAPAAAQPSRARPSQHGVAGPEDEAPTGVRPDVARDSAPTRIPQPPPEDTSRLDVAGIEATADGAAESAATDDRSPHQTPTQRPVGWRAGERDYVLEADLGGTTLSLDFIVYRAEDPFAEINGTEVHEGSVIEGFVVDRIERDRVVLRDGDGPLLLRVR